MPREKRHCIQRLDELWDFLDQSNISAKNIQRLRTLVAHPDAEVQGMATPFGSNNSELTLPQ